LHRHATILPPVTAVTSGQCFCRCRRIRRWWRDKRGDGARWRQRRSYVAASSWWRGDLVTRIGRGWRTSKHQLFHSFISYLPYLSSCEQQFGDYQQQTACGGFFFCEAFFG
jgi:hypothetical protein